MISDSTDFEILFKTSEVTFKHVNINKQQKYGLKNIDKKLLHESS